MKKLMILGFLTLGIVAAWVAVPTQEAEAFNCYECMFGGTTPTDWGSGSTCQAAINDAIFNAESQIPASCDVCQTTPIEVNSCFPYGSGYMADYKVRYKCSVDMCM